MITISIDLNKVEEKFVNNHSNGARYLSLTIRENKNGKDKWGNDYSVVQDYGKEERERMKREKKFAPFIGNGKLIEARPNF